jgi:release factor glutamine methyltransferase
MRFDERIEIETPPGVYEPAEDSMLMIEALEVRPGEDVLEVGCGTGIIALHCAKAGARVTASDVSIKAIECTRANAERNDLDITLVESDLLDRLKGEFEVIVFNPPYLPADEISDPRWTGGLSGLEMTLMFLEQCKRRLAPGGRVYIIVSTLSESQKFELAVDEMGYDHEIAARRHVFFEELIVYKLRMLTTE